MKTLSLSIAKEKQLDSSIDSYGNIVFICDLLLDQIIAFWSIARSKERLCFHEGDICWRISEASYQMLCHSTELKFQIVDDTFHEVDVFGGFPLHFVRIIAYESVEVLKRDKYF